MCVSSSSGVNKGKSIPLSNVHNEYLSCTYTPRYDLKPGRLVHLVRGPHDCGTQGDHGRDAAGVRKYRHGD